MQGFLGFIAKQGMQTIFLMHFTQHNSIWNCKVINALLERKMVATIYATVDTFCICECKSTCLSGVLLSCLSVLVRSAFCIQGAAS